MPKVSFNANALGIASYNQSPNMGHAVSGCAFKPVMVCRSGIEAIVEGLRLANVKGFEATRGQFPTGNVDT
jgi:hypothetical protein